MTKARRGDNVGHGVEAIITPLLDDMAAFDGLTALERAAIAHCGVKISAIDYRDTRDDIGLDETLDVLQRHTDPRLVSLPASAQASTRHSQLERRAIALIERVERRRRASPRR